MKVVPVQPDRCRVPVSVAEARPGEDEAAEVVCLLAVLFAAAGHRPADVLVAERQNNSTSASRQRPDVGVRPAEEAAGFPLVDDVEEAVAEALLGCGHDLFHRLERRPGCVHTIWPSSQVATFGWSRICPSGSNVATAFPTSGRSSFRKRPSRSNSR